MSTNINISVGDNKLLAQASLQQNASRQAQLEKEANKRLESQATDARTKELAAQGNDAAGNPVTGTGFQAPKTKRRPAAVRTVSPQTVYPLLVTGTSLQAVFFPEAENFYDDLYVDNDFEYAVYSYASPNYIIKLNCLDASQTFTFPLFSLGRDIGITYNHLRYLNSPGDPAGTWPSSLAAPTGCSTIFNPPDPFATGKMTYSNKENSEIRDINALGVVFPLHGGKAVIYTHCGRWQQVGSSKDVSVQIEAWLTFDTIYLGNDRYIYNQRATVLNNNYQFYPLLEGTWAKSFLITKDNVKEIATPNALKENILARMRKDTYIEYYTEIASTGGGGQGYKFMTCGVDIPPGEDIDYFVYGITSPRQIFGPNPPSVGRGSSLFSSWGCSGEDYLVTVITPTSYAMYQTDGSNFALTSDPIWQNADAVKAAYFPDYPAQKYGIIRVEEAGTRRFDTTKPPTNVQADARIVARGKPVQDTYDPSPDAFPGSTQNVFTYYWDWGKPEFCKEQAIALGFNAAEITL